MPLIKEACVENETQIDTAVKTKANRIELCSRLDFGGLTPSIDLINYVIAKKIPVVVMIRVNDKYNATWWEYRKMLTQIRKLRNLQIEGFIFGLLDKKGFIDYKRNKKLVKTCRDKQKIFHMAFDEFANWREAIDKLTVIGFNRILTKGGKDIAEKNLKQLRDIYEYARGKLEIVAGGKVNDDNYMKIANSTGIQQFHGRNLGMK